MAIFHQHIQVIGKSSGRSAVAAAAYRSGLKLQEDIIDKETGLTTAQVWDYSKKQGVVFSQIYAPENAPEWVYDREDLWNRVMHRESRKDAQYSREMDIALPVELTEEQNKELMAEIVKECYVKHGMIADANFHLDNPENPHFHVMLTMRDLVTQEDGSLEFGLKNREWNKKEFILKSREKTAEIINKHLEFYGHLSRVSHLSHKVRGIELTPTMHVGVAHHIDYSERKQLNLNIIQENAKRIAENPELVFDKLSINNPVFTKEEIAMLLSQVLLEVRDSEGKLVGNNDQKFVEDSKILASTLEEIDAPANNSKELEYESQEIASEFMISYMKLMNSDKITMVLEKDLKDRTLYAFSKRIELEKRFIQVVDRLKSANNHVLNLQESDLQKPSSLLELFVQEEKADLSREQVQAVLEIVNGPDIVALQGLPGAGKTTVMKEVVRQYKKAGRVVLGLATSENAALNLGNVTGIEALNIDKFRKNIQEHGGEKFELPLRMDFYNEPSYQHGKSILTDKHVLIVDEASMIELARSHYLNLEVARVGAKIIKLGDLNQFAPVGQAGAFKKECEVLKVSQLTEVRRQRNQEHIKATSLLAQYDIDGFLKVYDKEGSIKVFENKTESKKALVKDYIDSYIEKSNQLDLDELVAMPDKVITICAHTNEAVNELNQLVRRQLKQGGVIKGVEVDVALGDKRLKLARGEQIIFGQNSKKLGVLNGEIGTVLKIKKIGGLGATIITVKVQRADGSSNKIKIDSREKYVYQAVNYGYAVTAYKLQGTTVDRNFVYYESNVGYEGINVMMTRHREAVGLYVSKKELEDEVYKRIEEDPALARELHNIESSRELWKIGVGLSMHKRSNLSFVADYIQMGLSTADKLLKSYIEARSDFGKIIREIVSWQERQLKILGKKPAIYSHPDWEKAMLYKEQRDNSAELICSNYPDHQDRIIQLNLNYQTIKKHAGLSDNYRVNKVDQLSMLSNDNYMNLIKSLQQVSMIEGIGRAELGKEGLSQEELAGSGLTTIFSSVIQAFKELKAEIQERKIELEVLELQIADISQKRYMIEDQINLIERFTSPLFGEYIRRIYKSPPEETLSKWHELVKELGIGAAAKLAQNNPRKLGNLRGIGFGKWIGFTSKREDAIANLSSIGEKFKEYHNGEKRVAELQELLNNDQDLANENSLIEKQRQISLLLPNHYEEKLLKKLEVIIEGNESKEVNLRLLTKIHKVASSEFVQDEILALQYAAGYIDEKNIIEQGEITEGAMINLESKLVPRVRITRRVIQTPDVFANIINKFQGNTQGNIGGNIPGSIQRDIRESTQGDIQEDTDINQGASYKINQDKGHRENNKQDLEITNDEIQTKRERTRSPITFSNIKQALNSDDYQHIFKVYASFINEDGVIRQQGNNMMCGSLSMSLQSGLWMRHSTGDKGDIFHFVALASNKSKRVALKQIAEDLGFREENGQLVRSENNLVSSSIVDSKETSIELTSEWVAIKLVPEDAPPFKAEKHLAYLLTNNKLISTYQYRSKDNKLIGYVVRLEDRATGKKQVLPVSYCYNQDLGKSSWKLKGFTDELGYKPIYGAEKLNNSSKPVLIVEGEKTVGIAQELLPEYSVISWLGGSKAADNVNWQLLTNRNVVIWGDNDQPGFTAARVIQQKLNDIANSCLVVDPRVLNLPQKWDLGDASYLDINMIKGALVNSCYPESIMVIDQQIKALVSVGLNNEQLIKVLEQEVLNNLQLEGKNRTPYINRLQAELAIISKTGFAEDFVIAANIAKYCNNKYCNNMDIARGPGRGSAVSSLVAYGLGIHKIDPIENNLLFERFLTEGTISNPDFDFDIAGSKKILVENYLLAKYSNACKLLVISNKKAEEVKSIHPSGIGIVPNHLKEQLSYSKISDNFWGDRCLLDIDHKQAESLGVKKFDLLSSQVIEGVEKVERLIENKMGSLITQANEGQLIDWHKIGWNDSKTFALIKSADTEGVYQLGSNFAKEVASQVRLEKFEDLVNLLALIRPGTKNYIKYFADHNRKQAKFNGFSDPHNIFKDTKGIILFQEQVMQAAHSYLGIDKSQTNQFRKELEKASSSHPLVDKDNFGKAAMARGLNKKDATRLYDIMKEFSKFGYNKSHAIAYSQVTFKTAYLKTHHEEIFKEVFGIGKKDLSLEDKGNIKVVDNLLEKQEYSLPKHNQKIQEPQITPLTLKQSNIKVIDPALTKLRQVNSYKNRIEQLVTVRDIDIDRVLEIVRQGIDGINDNLRLKEELFEAIVHTSKYGVMTSQELVQYLLKYDNPNLLLQELKNVNEGRHIALMNENFKKIREQQEVKVGNKIFTSELAYAEHEIAYPSHAFSNVSKLKRNLNDHFGRKEKEFIASTLSGFAAAKSKINKPKEAMKLLQQEQEFYAGLYNNLRYDNHDSKLMEAINLAYENKQSDEIYKLYDTARYTHDHKIVSEEQLVKCLTSEEHLNVIHQEIITICYKYNCSVLKSHCQQINAGNIIEHDGKEFDSVVDYLEHWKDNVDHKLIPIKKIDQVIENQLSKENDVLLTL